MQYGINVETILFVKVPRRTFAGFGMDENKAAEGGDGTGVIIEAAIEILPGGFSRVKGGLMEKIESEFGLGKEEIPKILGGILVGACKNGANGAWQRCGDAYPEARVDKILSVSP